MKLVYICSPYRAADEATLQRNIDYARELTREILLKGEAAVTPHLYMTQCLNEADEAGGSGGVAESASSITIEDATGQKERTPLQRCPDLTDCVSR